MNGLFCHIPKTAGTSQISIINKYNHLKILHHPLYNNLTDIDPNDYFKWTFVRNPLDRLASVIGAWRYKTIKRNLNDILNLAELGCDLNWELPKLPHNVTNKDIYKNTDFDILQHIIPMSTILNNIKNNNNITIDYIGKFENINYDWNFIKNQINILDNLPNLNKSNHYPYQKYFNRKKFIDRAVSIYKEDFINFDYPITSR